MNSLKINLDNDSEVEFWTKKFNCTEEQLRKAVDNVGLFLSEIGECFGISKFRTQPHVENS
jgi:hypothetical protein